MKPKSYYMNLPSDILARLLKQFPVSSLRSYFDIKSVGQDHVIKDILEKISDENIIYEFAKENFEYCKQHIYVFECNSVVSLPKNFKVKETEMKFSNIVNNKNTLTYFIPVFYEVFDLIKKEEIKLHFLWPIRIQYFKQLDTNKYIILLKISILEKNLSNYFDKKIVNLGKEFDESLIFTSFQTELNKINLPIQSTDLTRGIKKLLEKDFIDFPSVKFRKSKSVSSEIMDEDFTIKANYPDTYNQIMINPLEKSTCKILRSDENSIKYFRVEPQKGILFFSLFSPSENSVDKIINLVLENNF